MRPWLRVALCACLVIIVAHLFDGWAWLHLARPDVYNHDTGRMLRTIGFLPIWLLVAIALWLQTRNLRRALLLGGVPTLSGIICEVLKILLRRERPGLHHGAYYFRPFTDRLIKTTDFGLPSSHAMVAFAAAWVLCRLYPRAWPVWIGLALGCALTRVEAEAHFLSDVTVGAVAAYFVVAVSWRMWGERVALQAGSP